MVLNKFTFDTTLSIKQSLNMSDAILQLFKQEINFKMDLEIIEHSSIGSITSKNGKLSINPQKRRS